MEKNLTSEPNETIKQEEQDEFDSLPFIDRILNKILWKPLNPLFVWCEDPTAGMDFKGQHQAALILCISLVLSTIVAFIVGYVNRELSHSIYLFLLLSFITAVITLLPWPCYKRNSIAWKNRKETKAHKQ